MVYVSDKISKTQEQGSDLSPSLSDLSVPTGASLLSRIKKFACETTARDVIPAVASTVAGVGTAALTSYTGPGAIMAGSAVGSATSAGTEKILQKVCGEEADNMKVLANGVAGLGAGVAAVGMAAKTAHFANKTVASATSGSVSSATYDSTRQIISKGEVDPLQLATSVAAGAAGNILAQNSSKLAQQAMEKYLPKPLPQQVSGVVGGLTSDSIRIGSKESKERAMLAFNHGPEKDTKFPRS